MRSSKGKVAVGMSGGVDSSVVCYLLKEKGYEVLGVYLEAWDEEGCEVDMDRMDAVKVAEKLGIKFKSLDVRKEYKEKVVEYFFDTYKKGLTPNPDVLCNSKIKFGVFYDWARKKGFDYVATGHYAKIKEESGKRYIQRPKELKKDQTYFLYRLEEKQLERVIFPLSEMRKDEVRDKARKLRLGVEGKPDSMGVCFIGDVEVSELLEKKFGESEGEVEFRGEVVGKHEGLWFYTVGQRGGFEVDKSKLKDLGVETTEMPPLYVVEKKIKENKLVVGMRKDVEKEKVFLKDLHWFVEEVEERLKKEAEKGDLFLRIRNLGDLVEVLKVEFEKGGLVVECKESLFGVAEGQSGVFYLRKEGEGEEIVLGGGVLA